MLKFERVLLECWRGGRFYTVPYSEAEGGVIKRSRKHDSRNTKAHPTVYTSLVANLIAGRASERTDAILAELISATGLQKGKATKLLLHCGGDYALAIAKFKKLLASVSQGKMNPNECFASSEECHKTLCWRQSGPGRRTRERPLRTRQRPERLNRKHIPRIA